MVLHQNLDYLLYIGIVLWHQRNSDAIFHLEFQRTLLDSHNTGYCQHDLRSHRSSLCKVYQYLW